MAKVIIEGGENVTIKIEGEKVAVLNMLRKAMLTEGAFPGWITAAVVRHCHDIGIDCGDLSRMVNDGPKKTFN